MCKNCELVEKTFEGAGSNPHYNLVPVYEMLRVLLKDKRLEIYAGDCPFEDFLVVLESEQHYTVKYYLQCPECKQIYFYGACIRGQPVFKKEDHIETVPMKTMMWGEVGTYYEK